MDCVLAILSHLRLCSLAMLLLVRPVMAQEHSDNGRMWVEGTRTYERCIMAGGGAFHVGNATIL